jgi:hypothetical protein
MRNKRNVKTRGFNVFTLPGRGAERKGEERETSIAA